MHRSPFIAAFVLLLASVPLAAQHGGGHGGFSGGHGGFSGHAGGFGGTHSFSGTRSFSAPRSGSSFTGRSFAPGSAFGRGFAGRLGRSGLGLRSYGYRCWSWGCGWGWGYGYPYLYGGIDPYWWWDNGSSDSGPDPNQQYYDGPYDNGWANGQGVPYRTPPQGDADSYARSAPPPPRESQPIESAVPATVLVFRDQHKQEVQNYAIVGQTLWTFSPQRTQKIPLTDLDIPATQKANDDRGVDFHVPNSGEGQ
jgi:hypothetical protein